MKKKQKTKPPYSVWSNIRYIYKILFNEVHIMPLFTVVGIIFSVLIPMMTTIISTVAVACITEGNSVVTFVIAMTAVLSINGIMIILNNCINTWSEFHINHVQNANYLMGLVKKSLYADYDNIEPQKQQALLAGASHAVNVFRQGVSLLYSAIPSLISSIIAIIIYSTTITMLDVRILIVIILMNVIGVFLNMRAQKFTNSVNEKQFSVWGRAFYIKRQAMAIESGKDIRIYHMRKWLADAFDTITLHNKEIAQFRNKSWRLASIVDVVFSLGRDLLAYVLLIALVLNGSISLAEFTFGLGIVTGFSSWVGGLRYFWSEVNNGNSMVNEYRKMIDYPDRFKREGGLGKKDIENAFVNGTLEIQFNHVSFRYTEDGPYILDDVNFMIKPGEKIALVGHNGAGKTTLIKLLCGLYHPTEGRILVGGHTVDEYNLEEYQQTLATIFQDVNIIPLSIASNVSGKCIEDTDMDKVEKCLKRAGLWDDVEKMNKKALTFLGQDFDEDGIVLSGGMVQKMMIARAMYKEASVLILDEPTAALDPIAESRLYEEYSNIANHKTSIFISHRLASTRFCSRIIYMENGKIEEEGTHEELIEKGGKYAEVFEVQSHYYQEENEDGTV